MPTACCASTDSGAMRAAVKGPHIPLLLRLSPSTARTARFADHLGASIRRDAARPPDARLRRKRAILYNTSEYMAPPRIKALFRGDGCGRRAADLFGSTAAGREDRPARIVGVTFISLPGAQKDARAKGFDGILPDGALPAGLHRPRRSLCRTRTVKEPKTIGMPAYG